MTEKNAKIQDHIEIHDRGESRKAARSGLVLYVNDGELEAVDDSGTVALPVNVAARTPVDVTGIANPQQGWTAYNDGSTGTEGPAHYNGTDWVSDVDGTTIA